MYFRKYRLWKTWLDNSLKQGVSEHPLTFIKLKCRKDFWNLHGCNFIIFFVTLRETDLENGKCLS